MGRYHNTDEECWIMGVELIVDVALPAESSDEDETGVGILTVACNQAFKALSVVGIGLVEGAQIRSEEHTSELQSLMRISYAVFCLKKNKKTHKHNSTNSYCHTKSSKPNI